MNRSLSCGAHATSETGACTRAVTRTSLSSRACACTCVAATASPDQRHMIAAPVERESERTRHEHACMQWTHRIATLGVRKLLAHVTSQILARHDIRRTVDAAAHSHTPASGHKTILSHPTNSPLIIAGIACLVAPIVLVGTHHRDPSQCFRCIVDLLCEYEHICIIHTYCYHSSCPVPLAAHNTTYHSRQHTDTIDNDTHHR